MKEIKKIRICGYHDKLLHIEKYLKDKLNFHRYLQKIICASFSGVTNETNLLRCFVVFPDRNTSRRR